MYLEEMWRGDVWLRLHIWHLATAPQVLPHGERRGKGRRKRERGSAGRRRW